MSSPRLTRSTSDLASSLHQSTNNPQKLSLSDLDRGVSSLYSSTSSSFRTEWSSMSDPGSPLSSPSITRKVRPHPLDEHVLKLSRQMELQFPKIIEEPPLMRSEQGKPEMQAENQALLSIWPRIASTMRRPLQFQTADQIRTWFDDPTQSVIINGITELQLSQLNLTVLPPEIAEFTQLTHLNLEHNNLSVLPKEFGHLAQLTILNLGHNKFRDFPKEIEKLIQLEELDFCGNQLSTLTKTFGSSLPHLGLLNLSNNKD